MTKPSSDVSNLDACIPGPQEPRKVSLDEKSARRIAAGRIGEYANSLFEFDFGPLPKKRIAWLRALEGKVEEKYGAGLLGMVKDKHRLNWAALVPGVHEQVGSLSIGSFDWKFGGFRDVIRLAQFSAHAVSRVMERTREIDPINAVSGEILPWMVLLLMYEMLGPHDFLLLPSKTGCFMGKRDEAEGMVFIRTWLPDRLLNDAEQAAVAKLRKDEQLGYCEKLADLC